MATINVTVYDSTENKRVPVELPDDAPVNKIILVLVEKLRLPKNGPDGAPLSYKFHHKNSGRQLQDSQSLSESGVHDGDILRLQPEITAGARNRRARMASL
ncbi:MAG TPA: EsaB/YukD family protein [Bryobacteraceae bacterium]|nr:EsaB/YukD family protein [Bryobacteraceae bacterium]